MKRIDTYITETLCCTPEANNMVNQLYFSFLKNQCSVPH